jgi:hypothetical protein
LQVFQIRQVLVLTGRLFVLLEVVQVDEVHAHSINFDSIREA